MRTYIIHHTYNKKKITWNFIHLYTKMTFGFLLTRIAFLVTTHLFKIENTLQMDVSDINFSFDKKHVYNFKSNLTWIELKISFLAQ